jgi:hypothetical protein
MKKAAFFFLQFVIFLIVFGVGSFLPPFHFDHVIVATPGSVRIFVADGLLLMLALYVVIVVVEILRKRLRTAAPWTTAAVILATALGLWMQLGFITR